MTTITPLYYNFDGLDVSFQGALPPALCEVLDQAKEEAQNTRASVLVEYNNQPMLVAESGAKGGYAYRCDTGPTGAIWFFSKNQNPANWNIRVSVKSNALASQGLGKVRHDLYRLLEALGVRVGNESISRVDYCMDFLAEAIEAATGAPFILDPPAFVMHSHTSRADHDDDAGVEMHGVSGRYTSVTCGKMPGRQVIVYDKSTEVRRKQKPEWWAHWNTICGRQGLPPLTGKERIWRVELRAGKNQLKERWGITTWAELDNKLGDVFARTLADIRYTSPNPTDNERFRWPNHPLWDAVQRVVTDDLTEMTCGAEPGVVKEVKREQLIKTMSAMITGLVGTWSVATGTPANTDMIAPAVAEMTKAHIQREPAKFNASRERSARKYRFTTSEASEIERRQNELHHPTR